MRHLRAGYRHTTCFASAAGVLTSIGVRVSVISVFCLTSWCSQRWSRAHLGGSREAVAAQVRCGDGHEVRRAQARHPPRPWVVQLADGVPRYQAALRDSACRALRRSRRCRHRTDGLGACARIWDNGNSVTAARRKKSTTAAQWSTQRAALPVMEHRTCQPDDPEHNKQCQSAEGMRTMECPIKLMRWRLRNVACRPCTSVTSLSPHLPTGKPSGA